ncbi:MAG: pimeloyl-ACP methyl ester carboxylesterase [Flavobacteriales bacterium]|jgi:pimeloyl-ACP methyl ester carboxylesterase
MNIIYKGASIFYQVQGQGRPLVLLHGFLENSQMWDAFLPILTETHQVICIDLLGHGQSECVGYVHSMEEMSQVVHAVIDILQLNDITIIGHSMGGYVACAFANAYPDLMHAICLLNSTTDPDTPDRKSLRKRANKMAQTQYEQLIRMSFVNLFDPEAKVQQADAIDAALCQALKTPLQGYMAANEGMTKRKDQNKFWAQTPCIKGMILGTNDWIINAKDHQYRFTPMTDFFVNIESGHMSHISNSAATLDAIQHFLSLKKQ